MESNAESETWPEPGGAAVIKYSAAILNADFSLGSNSTAAVGEELCHCPFLNYCSFYPRQPHDAMMQ